LIITGPLGKKKRAMIFARFSTPGTFPRKLRGEFRAPFSAGLVGGGGGVERTFSIFRIVPQREKNFTCRRKRVINVCDFLPHLPSHCRRPLSFSLSLALAVWYASGRSLFPSFVNCFRATRSTESRCERMKKGSGERDNLRKGEGRGETFHGGRRKVSLLSVRPSAKSMKEDVKGRSRGVLTYSASSGLHGRVMAGKNRKFATGSGCRVPRV